MNLENEIRLLKAENQVLSFALSEILARMEQSKEINTFAMLNTFRNGMLDTVHSSTGDSDADMQAKLEAEKLYEDTCERIARLTWAALKRL